MKYLSLFSGIGGFELGIEAGYSLTVKQAEEAVSGSTPPPAQYEKSLDNRRNTETPKLELHRDMSDLNSSYGNRWRTNPTCIGYSEIDKYAIQVYEKHFKHKNFGDITKIKEDELPDFDLLVGGFPCQAFSIAGKRKGFEDTRGTLFFDIARILRAKQPRLFLLENVKGLLSHDSGRTFKTIVSTLTELGYDLQWQVLNSKNFGVPQNRERVFIVGHLRGTSRPKVFPFGENGERDIKKQLSRKKTNEGNNIEDDKSRGGYSLPRIRRLTPKECERLQGFPDNWTEGVSDTQRYKCLGNAVTVNVIKEIINKCLKE